MAALMPITSKLQPRERLCSSTDLAEWPQICTSVIQCPNWEHCIYPKMESVGARMVAYQPCTFSINASMFWEDLSGTW